MRVSLVLAPILLLAPAASHAQDSRPPMTGKQNKLVAEYLSLDPAEDAARRAEILARLETVKPLSKSSAKSWRKKLAKAVAKEAVTLPKERGRHHFWTEPEEPKEIGLYILDGELEKPEAVFIGLHGGGVGSGEASGAHGMYASAMRELEWAGIFPEVLEKTELGWTTSGTEEFVMALVEAALHTWDVDPNRIYLGGHSMGGFGTWALGGHHPDAFAGLAPSAGGPSPVYSRSDRTRVVAIMKGVVPNLRNVRMVCYQSADDPKVPPGPNRFAAKRVDKARERWGGFDFEYWEVDGMGHGAPPGGAIEHLRKIAEAVRDPRPAKLVWEPALDWKKDYYWLRWEEPIENALVVAEVDREANVIRVETDAPAAGLSVFLDERLVDYKREVAVFFNGEEVFRGQPQVKLATLLSTWGRGDPELVFADRVSLSR